MRIDELWSAADERQLAAFQMGAAVEDLPRALVALEGGPAETLKQARQELDALAARVREKLESGRAADRALADVLAEESGFAGDPQSRPAGASLSEVLVARRGHPGLLVAIWLEVGRRAGLDVAAALSEERVALRLGGPEGALLDPLNRGQPLQPRDEVSEARTPETFVPGDTTELLARVLKDLLACHATRNDLLAVYRTITFVEALRPRAPMLSLQRAAIAEQLGAQGLASQIYREVATRFAGTDESMIAVHKLHEASARKPALLQ